LLAIITTTFALTILHDDVALVPASLASPDAPSSSVPAPLYVVESLTDVRHHVHHVPPLDDFHPAHQTTIESLRIPVTSSNPAIAGPIWDIITSGITTPRPTPETSASTPFSSTTPPGAVIL